MRCAIGLMSGTSMDGIDAALIRTDGENAVERGSSHFTAYDEAFRRRIEAALAAAKAITRRDERPGDLAALEREITLRHAQVLRALLAKAGGGWGEPEVIGFHGQTVLHRPEAALTVQLGDGALLARETGIPVVYDMRANDMAHGGQGAPLVPAYHAALARALSAAGSLEMPAVFVNIGGISNITYVPASGDPIAFDTGPGNGLLDQWVMQEAGVPFDENGAIAARGQVLEPVLASYLQKPFFARPGPKSLDRADFTLSGLERVPLTDGARSLAAVSARAILRAVDHLPAIPRVWVLCGGGRKNPHIVADLRHGASELGSAVLLSEEIGLNGDATEAEAWAYLAVRSLKGLPLTWPTTTGCREAVSGGVVAWPTT